MIYVFDTSAIVWLLEKPSEAERWMQQIPLKATIYYHPVTMAEIATQTHEEYLIASRRRTPEEARQVAQSRHALLQLLAQPAYRPKWLRRNFRPFDTGTKATIHDKATVYEQLLFERMQRQHLYRTSDGKVIVLADMVDHIILSLASFLHHDKVGLAAFVTRDLQLLEAAKHIRVPSYFASVGKPRATGGCWMAHVSAPAGTPVA